MRIRLVTLISIAAAGLVLVAPATGSGAVTIGSDLGNAPNTPGFNCNNLRNCTIRQATLPPSATAAGGLTAPISGVVVRFRVRSGAGSNPLTLRVIHPLAPSFIGAGTSAAVTPPPNQVSPPFDVRMPIAVGDSIGVDCCQAGQHDVHFQNAGAGDINFWGSLLNLPLADAEQRNFDSTNSNFELLLNADIEPDADNDGFGDETQDQCTGQAGSQALPCSGFTIKSAKARKKGKATLVVSVPGAGTLSAGGKAFKTATATRADPSVGDLTLNLKPTKSTRKKLEERRSLKSSLTVTYTPTGGSLATKTQRLRLRGSSKPK
jgi:hypothetical protein